MEKDEKCLICEVPVTEIHLGINCCRACFVFYKRTSKKSELRCKTGDGTCTSTKPKAMCRKCRYERMSSILNVCASFSLEKRKDLTIHGKATLRPASTSFIDEKLSTRCETPTLERMKKAYEVLYKKRKIEEMSTYSTSVREQFQRGNINYAPATYTNVVPHAKIMFAGLLDFFSSAFEDFRNLTKDKQQLLVYNNFELMNRSDDLYRAVKYFPDDDTLMPSFTTVFSVDSVDEFLSECPPGVNKEEAREEIIKNTNRTLLVNKAHFKRIQLTREEFLVFMGLALWKERDGDSRSFLGLQCTVSIEENNMTEMVKRNRENILTELHRHYATMGRFDYSARLGEILCLLISMEELATQHTEDREVYLLMNMFNEYTTIA